MSFPSSFSLKSKLLGSWISFYYLHMPHLGNSRPRFGSGLSANYCSCKDTRELINSMHVLTMHINLVNASREIQVWGLNGKTSFSQVFASLLQVQPPLSPQGIGSDAASCTLLIWPEHKHPCFLRRCSFFPSSERGHQLDMEHDWKPKHTTFVPLEK